MRKLIVLVALILTIPAFAQETHKPIEVAPEMRGPIEQANKEIELARLRKDNIILQIRLILKVPNEYSWDEGTMSFKPPAPAKKDDKKEAKP